MSLSHRRPSFLDSTEGSSSPPRLKLALRLDRLGWPDLAREIRACTLGNPPDQEECRLPHHCRKAICPSCMRVRELQKVNRFADIIQTLRDPDVNACMATSTPSPGPSLSATFGVVKDAFRAFSGSKAWRRLRREDPSLGLLKAIEIGKGETRPGHPHAHVLIVSKNTSGYAAGVWREFWEKTFPGASASAQDCTEETSDPEKIRGLIGYVSKGSELSLAWPDEAFHAAVELLTSSGRSLNPAGSLWNPNKAGRIEPHLGHRRKRK